MTERKGSRADSKKRTSMTEKKEASIICSHADLSGSLRGRGNYPDQRSLFSDHYITFEKFPGFQVYVDIIRIIMLSIDYFQKNHCGLPFLLV